MTRPGPRHAAAQVPFYPGVEDATVLIQRITDEAVLDEPTLDDRIPDGGRNPAARTPDRAVSRAEEGEDTVRADPARSGTGSAPGGAGVVRASAQMAVATVVSRVTGLLAKVLIGAIIGAHLVNSAYTLANTLPNIVFELLIGGVLTSVAIPLLTRAQRDDADGGQLYAQRLITLATVGLLVATAIAVACAPLLTRLYLPSNTSQDVGALLTLAGEFAVLLLPQIFFYGLAALFGAVLNTKERFAANAWAPVCNNVIVMIAAGVLWLRHRSALIDPFAINHTDLLILGLGTTAGIVVQAAVMLPALRRAGFAWRWRWGWDQRFGEAGGLLAWATGYVLVSQIGVAVLSRLTSAADPASGWYRFSTASLIFQMPYGILGVAVLTAIMPRMSRHAAAGELETVKDDVSLANRLSTVALLPVSAALFVLGGPITTLIYAYGNTKITDTRQIGATLAVLGLGLLPLAVTLVQMRVFYAMKDGRTPTLINAIMVGVRVPAMLAAHLVFPHDVITGFAAATALSYLVGAVVGEYWLRARFGPMGTTRLLVTVGKTGVSAVLAAGAAYLGTRALVGSTPHSRSAALVECLVGGAIGLVVLAIATSVLRVAELVPLRRRLLRLVRRSAVRVPAPVAAAAESPAAELQAVHSPAVHPPAADLPTAGTEPSLARPAMAGSAHRPPPPPAPDLRRGLTEETQRVTSTPGGRAEPPAGAAPAAAANLAPGTTVGKRYRLVSLIAADAAGSRFWRARDMVLPRDMALTLLPDTNAAAATVARTLRVGRLDHIGLPQTLDVGVERGQRYVVGQWVDGATLTDLLAGGPLEPDVATAITAKISEAVAEAHRNGLALGSINPSLVRVNFDGQVRLSHVIAPATATPDQDIRAVGALLYLMLTGSWPLPATAAAAARTAAASPEIPAPPAPTRRGRELPAAELRPGIPEALSALAERALHPDEPQGIHAVGAIAALLRTPELGPAAPATPVEEPTTRVVLSAADRRVIKERRIKLGVAAGMLAVFGALIVIVVASLSKQILTQIGDTGPTTAAAPAAGTTAATTPPQSASVAVKPAPSTARSGASVAPSAGSGASRPVTPPSVSEPSASSVPPVSNAAPSGPVIPSLPVTIVAATVYDPQGDGNPDYPSRVDRAFDGNPTSAWTTLAYHQQFPALKQGVGLTVQLEKAVVPTSVTVTSDTPGTVVEIRSATSANTPLAQTLTLGSGTLGNGPLTIPLTAAPSSQYLTVWITHLAPRGSTRFQSRLNEIAVTGH